MWSRLWIGILWLGCLGLATCTSTTQPESPAIYDVLVLGAGPAGLTAALFAARAGLAVLVLGSDAGSSLSEATNLDNFPGFGGGGDAEAAEEEDLGGTAWLKLTKRKAMRAGAQFVQAGLLASNLKQLPQGQDTTATLFQLELQTTTKTTRTNNTTNPLQILGQSVILAVGATGKRLGIPLEDRLWGKSVHSCAVCDGNSYVDQVVLVVGGGDAAVDAALLLARYAKRVVLVHRRSEFRASNKGHVQLLNNTGNIYVATPFFVKQLHAEIEGGKNQKTTQKFTGVRLQNTETMEYQNTHCDGVFVMIGSTPNTEWLKQSGVYPQLELDVNGYILGDKNMESIYSKATTVPGIFVAGEATDQIYRQAITAAAEGAQAAMDAERWLRSRVFSADLMGIAPPQSQTIPLQTMDSAAPTAHHRLRGQGGNGGVDPQEQRKTQEQSTENVPPDPPAITCDVGQKECLDAVVREYPLVVFSQPRCPQCQQLMETLALEGITEVHPNANIINISKLGTTKANKIRAYLKETTGRKSFPSVFLGGKWIAGEAQTRIWHKEGKLKDMFEKAGVFDKMGETSTVDTGQEEL